MTENNQSVSQPYSRGQWGGDIMDGSWLMVAPRGEGPGLGASGLLAEPSLA